MRKFICAILAGAVIGSAVLSGCAAPAEEEVPAVTAEVSPVQALTGQDGGSAYLTCGSLTATREDYADAVRDVGNALWLACFQRGIPFREYLSESDSDISALLGIKVLSGNPTYAWDNTVDGVSFDRYLDQRARVLAFYRSWSESQLAPVPTEDQFRAWAKEQTASGEYLRFYHIFTTDEENAQQIWEELNRDESYLTELRDSYPPEADLEYAGPASSFVPEIAQALAEANGQWTIATYSAYSSQEADGPVAVFSVIKALPLTIENYRSVLLEEAWPTAIDEEQIVLADGAEELNAAQLYEDWFAWAVAQDGKAAMTVSTWARLSDQAVIVQAAKE